MKKTSCLLLVLFCSLFVKAQIAVWNNTEVDTHLVRTQPVIIADSSAQLLSYTHSSAHGTCRGAQIDSVVITDGVLRFHFYQLTDVCQQAAFRFALYTDSMNVLRIRVLSSSIGYEICQGVNCNTFTVSCRITSISPYEIKGVGFSWTEDYTPVMPRKR